MNNEDLIAVLSTLDINKFNEWRARRQAAYKHLFSFVAAIIVLNILLVIWTGGILILPYGILCGGNLYPTFGLVLWIACLLIISAPSNRLRHELKLSREHRRTLKHIRVVITQNIVLKKAKHRVALKRATMVIATIVAWFWCVSVFEPNISYDNWNARFVLTEEITQLYLTAVCLLPVVSYLAVIYSLLFLIVRNDYECLPCGEVFADSAKTCPKCGETADDYLPAMTGKDDDSLRLQPAGTISGSRFYDCPDCGAGGVIPNEEGKCTNCGYALERE